MAQTDELIAANHLNKAQFYINRLEENETYLKLAIDCILEADLILKKNIRETFICFSPDIIINFSETAIQLDNDEMVSLSEFYIDMFFQRNFSKGQMFVRALLVKARLIAREGHVKLLKGEKMLDYIQKSLNYVRQALNIVSTQENKQKYQFLIYNTSVCVYNIIRSMVKHNWIHNFTEFVEKLDKLFDEVDDPDYNWRCRYSWLLFYCLYDQDKKADANKVLDRLWDTTKKKGNCNFQDQLFRLRIHLGKENSNILKSCKTDAEQNEARGWKLLLTLQMMRSGLVLEAQIEKELINVINSMNSSVLPGNEIGVQSKLTPVVQERLAEAGRIALQHNLINIADNITNFLGKERSLSAKPFIMHEYNKAELYIKKAGPLIDGKTGMRLNSSQIKQQEVERRIDALKILEKVMIANKKTLDPDLVYDGAVLIWNIGLPFLNATYKHHVHKAFQSASQLIDQIQSNDHALRVNFHLELAKIELQDDYVIKAEQHIKKALALDYSIPLSKITTKYDENEDLSIYQRPYEKYLISLREKIKLKQNFYGAPDNVIEKVTLDLENAQNSKSESTKIKILQQSLGRLVNLDDLHYIPKPNLVQEEIDVEMKKHHQQNLWISKQKKLLAGEIAKMAFEWEFNEVAIKANEFVLADTWQPQNAEEMILVQVECCYNMAQIKIDQLKADNFEIAYKDPVRIVEDENENSDPNQEDDLLSNEKKEEVLQQKRSIIEYYLKGLKLAESIQQSWLVFNGAIHIWNNYLSTFRNPINDSKQLEEISSLLKEFFETMKNSFKELEKKQIIDYDSNTKIQVNSNIGIIYARLMEGKQQYEEVMRVCEALLQLPLGSHTRKLINSIKARVAQTGKAGGGGGGGKAADKGKKAQGKDTQQVQGTSTEHVLFAVVSQLEVITNSTNSSQQNMADIVKCFETLETWQAKENDETELELHAELWAKLARLALNIENTQMYKYSLRCVEKSLSLLNKNLQTDLQSIPASRLRWYSLAEYLYSENLLRMLNPDTQETESQEQLLFHALKHAVEGANKGMKANMNSLVLDAAKMVWNICAKLQESAINRKALIKPIFSTLFYLKQCKEKSEPDLILLLAQLLFKACIENEEYAIGENVTDMVFELVPKPQQKPIWEAKMIFMSQQGKNELQAIQNMKEADASLQSKVQIRLARASKYVYKQCQAYERAIKILEKENSVEIVEVYIEFSEWLLRNDYDIKDVIENLNEATSKLIEIEHDEDEEGEEDDDQSERASTLFAKSLYSKSKMSRGSPHNSRLSKSKKGSEVGKNSLKSQKKSDIKGEKPRSNKASGNQNNSRTSRTGVRVMKTIKQKQNKSIFTNREEEPSPESLNCAHYERLVRIHVMLALIAQSVDDQMHQALSAQFFLKKIFEVSFRTLNQMAENAASYSNKIIQQKQGNEKDAKAQGKDTKQPVQTSADDNQEKQPQYRMPESIEEWINLQFSKEFLEKVKTSEDYNFMCKFLFEKAEVTFKYIEILVEIFEKSGLHSYCIPLMVFQRFYAKEIICSSYLGILQELKFCRLLHLLGYHEQGDKVMASINLQKLQLSEHERKQFLAKTESSRIVTTTKKIVDLAESYVHKPLLIKEIQPYQIWIESALELFKVGDLVRARDLLQESYKHTQILSEKFIMGEIHIYLGMISYLEGDYSESLEHHMKSHKLIKDIDKWHLSLIETFKTLIKLNKGQDIKSFINRIIEIFQGMRINKTQDKTSKYQAVTNKIQIEQILATAYLLYGQYQFKELVKEYSKPALDDAVESLKYAQLHINEGGALQIHFEIYLKIFFKLQLHVESLNFCDPYQVNNAFQIIGRVIKFLSHLAITIKQLLKYTQIIEREQDIKKTPLLLYYCQIRIQQASCYNIQGVIKALKRKFKENLEDVGSDRGVEDDEDDEDEEEMRDKVEEQQLLPVVTQKYIQKIQQQIDALLMPVSKNLQDFEKAASILTSCKNMIPKDHYLYLVAQVELARAQRYQLEKDELLGRIWLTQEEFLQKKENEDEDDYQIRIKPFTESQKVQLVETAQYTIDFVNQNFQQLIDPLKSKYTNYYLKKISTDLLENLGKKDPERTFEFLCKLQHFKYSEHLIKLLKKALQGKHKFVTYQRLNKHVEFFNSKKCKDVEQSIQSDFKLWNQVYDIPNYTDIINQMLPNQSVYVLIQLSEDKKFLYYGCLYVQKDKETGQRNIECNVKRKELKLNDHNELELLNYRINEMKKVLIKTPVQTESEFLEKFFNPSEEEFCSIVEELENFCKFFTDDLEELLNKRPETPQEEEEQQQQQTTKKDSKKDTKKDAKGKKGAGGGKDELPPYESPLQPTQTGFESVVLLIDVNLFNLPFEALNVFREVPALSRDFNLILQGKRLKSSGFTPSVNNSQGISKDKLKYVFYNFKTEQNKFDALNAKPVVENFIQKNPQTGLKFEGDVSSHKVTSLGEWRQFLEKGSMLTYYGHPGILNVFTPKLFIDMIEISNTKCFMLFDKINAKKQVLEKYSSLEPDGDKTPLVEQFTNSLTLLSTLGVETIGTTQWTIEAEQFPKMLDIFINGANEEVYIASTMQKFREPTILYKDQYGNIVDPEQIQREKEEKEKAKKEAEKAAAKKPAKKDAKKQSKQQEEENENKEEQQEEEEEEIQIIEHKIEKKKLHINNFVFVGVPVLRVQ